MRRMLTLAIMLFLAIPIPLVAEEPAQAAPGTGRVNVYRFRAAQGKGVRPSIYVDEQKAARLQSGRYVVLAVPAGKHTFRSTDKQSQIELDLKAGQEYYIRVDLAVGMFKAGWRVTLVQPEQGAGEVKQMKPIDAGMIQQKELVATDFKPMK